MFYLENEAGYSNIAAAEEAYLTVQELHEDLDARYHGTTEEERVESLLRCTPEEINRMIPPVDNIYN